MPILMRSLLVGGVCIIATSFGVAGQQNCNANPDQPFCAGSWATFEGENAIGFAGAIRIDKQLSVNGAVGIGETGKQVGTRLGVRYGW